MTTSLVRVFRYIGSFIALKLMTALLDLNETVKTNINHTLRQIDVARSSVKHNSERLEVLMDKEQELQENLDELEQVFSFYYKAVFKERYRDVAPLIRSMCIVELGEWLKKVPEKFVHDAHLRYVGWLMQDTMGDVRLSCLQVLHAVYKVQTLKEKLITFTCKFKERLLLMTLDKRIDVSILAIEIYGFIYKFFPEFREEKDLQHMYDLMFSKHRTIAHAAGIFITNTVSQLPCQLSEKSKHGKPWLPNTLFLYKMVRIFVESKMEKYEAYLVDSLIETNEALKDWECMTDLLLEEPDNETDALSDLEENSLISILLCCIQQSVSRVGPPGRETSAKMLSRKERKQMHDDKINITEHFIEKLPMLLTKYETDAENLQRLLSIPQYLELDMYTTPRKEQYLDKLLDKLRTITERHHSKEVLESCIKTLDALCSLSSSTSLRGTVTCKRIIDTILAKYKDAREQFQSSIDADELPSEDQVYTMICCARKVATFYDHFDLSGWHVWGDFFPVIQQVTEGNTLIPEEMIQHCITACYFSLLWDLRETEKPDKQDGAVMNKVKALRSHLEMLINHLSKLLGMSLKNCKEEAYITICDLLIIFKEGGYQYLGKFSGLEYSPSRDLQLELLQIVEEYVFSEENKAAQSVNHCNMLACFIKLFLYNVIPVKAAANILVHYNEPSSNYGELMKEALDKLLVKNRKNCSYVVILALKIAFTKLLNSEVDIHHNKQGYSNLLELATNLSKVFEEDIIKNREAIVNLHIAGINVALEPLQECDQVPQTPPDSLIFLKILTEVTHILLPQDGRSIVKYLDQEIASLHITNQGRDWPLQTYRNTLLHLKTKKPIQPPATRKGRSEKRNITESGSEEERDARRQAELTITNETDGRLHPRSSKTTPSSRHRDSLVRKRRLPVKVIRHPSGQLRHQRSLPESPLLTISDIPEISGTLIHPSSTPYIQH
ncbi:cohesin subunit SA-1 [Anabrus simplex]|uniref:cohesin subunit SA-1 n=1 Tax=Anabrus simplex TaxID=316456 RepID=UPI0035A29469